MKGLLATTAVLGVLAIGGLPALALTLAAEETGPDAEPTTTLVEDDGARPGPPPWAQGRGPADKGEDDRAGAQDEGEPPAWARREDGAPPPGWTRNHSGQTPHGWAVREWAACVAEKAADREPGERVDPQADCGGKPLSPGKAKKEGAAGQPPDRQGRSTAPGQQDRAEPPGQAAKPEKTKKAKPDQAG